MGVYIKGVGKEELIDILRYENVFDAIDVSEFIEIEADRKTEPQRNMAEDIVESFGFNAESYRQAKAKDEPQTE